jgi:hypothetical protein
VPTVQRPGPPVRAMELASTLLGPIHAMRGIITGRDVVNNVGIIYREFGARCLVRCLWVLAIGRRTTFLDVISQH